MRFRLFASIALAAVLCSAGAHAEKGDAFQPKPQATVNQTFDSSGENIAVQTNGQLRFYNSGTVAAFCRIETGTTAASASTDFPVAPGSIEIMTGVGDHVACITASGSTTIYITPGAGL